MYPPYSTEVKILGSANAATFKTGTKREPWEFRFIVLQAVGRATARDGMRGRPHYFIPTIMIVKEPGTVRPRPAGVPAGGDGGGGAASDAIANR